jgi:hypothetical protein
MTSNGDMWRRNGDWTNCGPWPGTTVDTDQESWGGVKGKYNDKD